MNADAKSVVPLPARYLRPPCFDADDAPVREWLCSLRSVGLRRSSPALILALEGLRRAQISASRRLAMLRLLKLPVLKIGAGLPKPWLGTGQSPGAGAASAPRRGVTLEQRLYRLMFQNLHEALLQLDATSPSGNERWSPRREWVLRNLLRFCGRQFRYAALWGCPLPVNAWRDLHDLYVYLMVRHGARPADRLHQGVDPSHEYKQLLLFGVAVQLTERAVRSSAVRAGLGRWAADTLLEDPCRGLRGEPGRYLVEAGADRPPYPPTGPLDAAFRGWVLLPPPEFFAQLESSARDHAVVMAPPPPLRQQAPQRPRIAAVAG